MNPIEAGARAIAELDGLNWDACADGTKQYYIADSRAAAIAMVGELTEQGTHSIRRVAFEPFCAELTKQLTED